MTREFPLPGTKPRYAVDRTCDIDHIKLAIDLDFERRRIAARCSITLSPLRDRLRWVVLDAVELDIERVSWHGEDLQFVHDGKLLRVDLGRDTEAREIIVLDISYSGRPRRGLYFIAPDEGYPKKPVQVWTQGQDRDSRYWFPCFDSPNEKATSEVIATVPAHMFALSNGTLVADTTEGDRRTLHWRFDVPHSCYLITLAAGDFCAIHDRWDNVEVSYYGPREREEDVRRTAGRTPEMLALFSRLFRVPYPYEKYAQVFVSDFIFGGMENTTATTLTDVMLLDERAALDFDAGALVAHELAHQWFGDLLTCREWGEGWLNEGFATYCEYLWREHAEGEDAAALELDEWARMYFDEDRSRYRRTVATNVYDEPIDIFDAHLYKKGGRVLHMLRRTLGDDEFFAAIEHYLTKHRTGSVETRDLARAVEESTGRALDWFFDQWITKGAGHPELDVSYTWDADHNLAVFTVKQVHEVDGQTPLFRLGATLRCRVGDSDRDVDVDISEAHHTFYVPLAKMPTQAIFDPGKPLLAGVKMHKPTPLWVAELEGAGAAIDRIDAARALGSQGGTVAVEALSRALAADPFWGVRAVAAQALGDICTAAARAVLIDALSTTDHPRVRRAIVRALGAFRGDERAAAALADIVEHGDESYFVEAEACLSLGKTRDDSAPHLLRLAIERDSFMDVIRQRAYLGLAEARDDSALPVLLAATAYGRPMPGRRAALAALAQLVHGRRDRDARDARERAEELLTDSQFGVQNAAITALATIADPAAIPALERLLGRELDGRLRRRAREVIRDLSEGRGRAEELTALRNEVERLRADSLALKERIDRLEAAAEANRRSSHAAGARPAKTTAAAGRVRKKAAAGRAAKATAGKTAARAAAPAKGRGNGAKKRTVPAKPGKNGASKAAGKSNGVQKSGPARKAAGRRRAAKRP